MTRLPFTAVPRFVAADALHLILMPTEKCNFRCTYCYEDFVHGTMGRPVIEGIKALIAGRAPGLTELSLEWFGGEPLLEPKIIEEIQEHVVDLAKRHPSMDAHGAMTTNGYLLTPDRLERLVERGITAYQISFDGTADAHDRRRIRADGRGTFERVWSHVLAARDTDLPFRICLRLHVDRHNGESVRALIDKAGRELVDDPRFELFIRPISRLGGPADEAIPVLLPDESGIVQELKDHAEARGLALRRLAEPAACYAAAATSFVVRATGELAKCTVALDHPNNRVGRLRPDGTAELDRRALGGWLRGLHTGNADHLACPMKGYAEKPATLLPILA